MRQSRLERGIGPRPRNPGTVKRASVSAALAGRERRGVSDERGAVAFEFLLVSPFLLFILYATVVFGIALNQQLILTAAAQQGAQVLSLGRGTTTPYTATISAITSSAVNLTTSKITETVSVGGSTCASDSACTSLLTGDVGSSASVALSYPCYMTVMGIAFGGSSCTLYASSAATVQ